MTEHHLAANFTVVNGKATFIPMFNKFGALAFRGLGTKDKPIKA